MDGGKVEGKEKVERTNRRETPKRGHASDRSSLGPGEIDSASQAERGGSPREHDGTGRGEAETLMILATRSLGPSVRLTLMFDATTRLDLKPSPPLNLSLLPRPSPLLSPPLRTHSIWTWPHLSWTSLGRPTIPHR